ncbi:hypothetical protein KEM09_09820 [Carboxylicivirga mesophila]|uniref:SGNH hydrolase-type esterase domain-containing protein n=1 Tax=Carboxylicivirga mesophila TaxID=1166478 RepID=A0ABS5K9P2_9BACT|nr:GDSL-type esterase/lipase family protein [Carboxylicivirga mesophila]MBS2211701.1 hypothetical protein [Carboxylicivirga mesophila]
MSQQLRILVYFMLIGALVLALVHYVPFPFQPANWQIKTAEELIIPDMDSLMTMQPELPDTIPPVKKAERKDTIITQHHLSYSTSFFEQLKQLHGALHTATDSGTAIRILHFGDSQIEGDRITAYLREAFQSRFGGSGPGLTTVFDPAHINPSVWIDSKGNWQAYHIYNRRNALPNKAYGLMGQTAALHAHSAGEFKISASRWAEQHASNYQKIRLFIAPHTDTIAIKGQIKHVEIINDSLPPSSDLTEINWEFEQLSPSIRFQLTSNSDVHVLACALDSLAGVSVDNIALRGQSTPLLHRTDANLFKAMGEQLNIGMIIFQFGTNMIPTVAPNYRFYQVQLARQFDLIKSYLPNVPVLVVGIADAAHNHSGEIQSYEHLHRINEAQKAIALKYDFAFFDLYNAMGGEGSIIKWTEQQPPLALTDYIHFSRLGGKKAAQLMIKATWHQFNKFETPETTLLIQPDMPWERY